MYDCLRETEIKGLETIRTNDYDVRVGADSYEDFHGFLTVVRVVGVLSYLL